MNNTKLFIAIAIFMVLAVFGAAVFMGYTKPAADPVVAEETVDESSAAPEADATTETNEAASESGDTDTTTASEGGHAFSLDHALSTRAIGNPNAPVKIVEYMSLTCHHCAHFHTSVLPDLKTKYIDTGKIYLEIQEFPLNAPALDASLLARCLPADRYESFIGLLFKTQEDWTTRPDYITVLKQNAKLAGLSDEATDQCLTNSELRKVIGERIQQASEKYKISSTPTFVFNDGADFIRGAMPVEEFEKVMAKLSGETPAAPETEEAPAAESESTEEAPAAAPVEEPVAQ